MSDCGNVLVTCLAAALGLVVLLVAGVAYLALEGAKLVGGLALQGIEFAGQQLVKGIQLATQAIQSAGPIVMDRLSQGLADTATAAHEFKAQVQASMIQLGSSVASITRARAVETALRQSVPLSLVADARYGHSLTEANDLLAQADLAAQAHRLDEAARLGEQAEALYTTASHGAFQTLANAERAVITAQAGTSLVEMGYEVKVGKGEESVALVGRKGEHSIALMIQPGGQIGFDMAGFAGSDCDHETDNLMRRLEHNGLKLGKRSITRHGCLAGGPMLRKAQKRGLTLEQALVEMVEAPEAEYQPVKRKTHLHEENAQTKAAAWVWGSSAKTGSK